MISPGCAVSERSEKIGTLPQEKDSFASVTSCGAGIFSSASGSGDRISGLMRFHETSAFCTALNSFATLEDLTVSLVKQERKVVNAAMSHDRQPVPSTFFPPNHRMNSTPAQETAR